MADTYINNLPPADTPQGADAIIVEQSEGTKRLNLNDLFVKVGAGTETLTSLSPDLVNNKIDYSDEAGNVSSILASDIKSLYESNADTNALTDALKADIENSVTEISTNTANIATNTVNIATNTADIATNTANITTLQNTSILVKRQSISSTNQTSHTGINLTDWNAQPSHTEGVEIMVANYTPVSTSNHFRIQFIGLITNSGANPLALSLFNGNSIIGATHWEMSSGGSQNTIASFEFTGTTASPVFSFRVAAIAGTTYVNKEYAVSYNLGGLQKMYMIIEEYQS